MDLLRSHSEGLIATSGCLSAPVPRAILHGEVDRAWTIAQDFRSIFGDRYYLELQRHGIPAQDTVNAELVKMSADLRVPLGSFDLTGEMVGHELSAAASARGIAPVCELSRSLT